MVDKYRCYGKDDFGDPYDALSMKDPYGEWVRAEDYDALDAAATALGTEVLRRVHGGWGWVPPNVRLLSEGQYGGRAARGASHVLYKSPIYRQRGARSLRVPARKLCHCVHIATYRYDG